jgi:hypothetical protein
VAVGGAAEVVKVMRLDAREGKTIWTADLSRTIPRGDGRRTVTREDAPRRPPPVSFRGWCADNPRPVVIGRSCHIASGSDLRVLDAQSGRETLRVRLPRGQTFHAPPAVLGENLLYATAQGVLVEIHGRTGSVRRALDLGAAVTSQPVVAEGRVHVVAGGVLLGVRWGERDGPAWPQWGGSATRSGAVLPEAVTPRRR